MDEIIHGLPTLIIGFDYVDKQSTTYKYINEMKKIIQKSKTTKKLQCRCENCTNIVEVASTSLSVICSLCTFKMAEGILEYSK